MGELCGAKLNKKRGTCKKPAGHGTSHPGYGYCSLHLGCTPMGERWAIMKEIEAKRRGYGVALDLDPHDALLLCIRIGEGEGRLLAEAVRGILEELGVGKDPRVPTIVRKYLTQITATARG